MRCAPGDCHVFGKIVYGESAFENFVALKNPLARADRGRPTSNTPRICVKRHLPENNTKEKTHDLVDL